MRYVVAKPHAVIDAVALAARIARNERCAGKQQPRLALRVAQAPVKREAAQEFPARVDVGIPGAGGDVPEIQAQSGTNAQRGRGWTQRVLVEAVERGFDGDIVLPAITAVN